MRLQRTGRKGQAHYRLVAQDARRHPSSGKVAAYLGGYNPHAKTVTLDKEKIQFYLEHGAQPSDRVAKLLKKEGVKLPKWVNLAPKKKSSIRHPEKLRKNRPAEAKAAAPADTKEGEAESAAEGAAEESAAEAPEKAAAVAEPTEMPTEESKPEAPTSETVADEEPVAAEAQKPAKAAAKEPKSEAAAEEKPEAAKSA